MTDLPVYLLSGPELSKLAPHNSRSSSRCKSPCLVDTYSQPARLLIYAFWTLYLQYISVCLLFQSPSSHLTISAGSHLPQFRNVVSFF
ncbi:hypothetical protein MHYP_G00193550, partial [Metynnis hypsauchen]